MHLNELEARAPSRAARLTVQRTRRQAALFGPYTRLACGGGRLWVMLSERSQPARAFGLMRWDRAMPLLRSLDDLP